MRRLFLTFHAVFAWRRWFVTVGIERRGAPGAVRERFTSDFIFGQNLQAMRAVKRTGIRYFAARLSVMEPRAGIFGRCERIRARIGRIANAHRQYVLLEFVNAVHLFVIGLEINFLRIAGGIDRVGRLLGFCPSFLNSIFVAVEFEGGASSRSPDFSVRGFRRLSNCQVPPGEAASCLSLTTASLS